MDANLVVGQFAYRCIGPQFLGAEAANTRANLHATRSRWSMDFSTLVCETGK